MLSRKKIVRAAGLAPAIAWVAWMAGCGSSPDQVAGIDGSGARVVAVGPIQAFGSIVVGGTHYAVDTAEVRINGELATDADLALGQVVRVEAHADADGRDVADRVDFDANVIGPVQSIAVAAGELVVLGQTVGIDSQTVLDGSPPQGIAAYHVGDVVEVSGLVGAGGMIAATRIARADPGAEFRIVGRVAQLDSGLLRFSIGGLVVDYGSAGLIQGFPAGGPANGDEVIAVGSALDSSGALVATRLSLVRGERSEDEHEGDGAEVEGLVTRFVSVTDFDVAGSAATTTSATSYEGGTAADLKLNVKIQIEGRVDSQGVIVAQKIEIKDGGAVRF